MYMYPSTRMLARSQAPHTFTYISLGYVITTCCGESFFFFLNKIIILYNTKLQYVYGVMKFTISKLETF